MLSSDLIGDYHVIYQGSLYRCIFMLAFDAAIAMWSTLIIVIFPHILDDFDGVISHNVGILFRMKFTELIFNTVRYSYIWSNFKQKKNSIFYRKNYARFESDVISHVNRCKSKYSVHW